MEIVEEIFTKETEDFLHESLKASNRMLLIAFESEQFGSSTLSELEIQSKKLDKIEETEVEIDEYLNSARKTLTVMESIEKSCFCSCLILPFLKRNRRKELSKSIKDAQNPKEKCKMKEAVEIEAEKEIKKVEVNFNSDFEKGDSSNLNPFEVSESEIVEKKTEQNLVQVSEIIQNLRGQALEMGKEVDKQNDQIEQILIKHEQNELKMKFVSKQAKKLNY